MEPKTENTAVNQQRESVDDQKKLEDCAKQANELLTRSLKELGQNLVGMDSVIEQTLITLLAGGHALLEGPHQN